MKQFSMLGIISGAALLIATPFSVQWSQKNAPLSVDSAEAAEASIGVVSRRAYRRAVYAVAAFPRFRFNVGLDRYRPEYISPPAGGSYYLAPFSFVSSYNFR